MEGKRFYRRTAIFTAVMAACFLFAVAVLYKLQVVHGADYLAQSDRTIATTETVKAARGEITDRNGTLLVANRLCYNVLLDTSAMGGAAGQNAQILTLTAFCRGEGIAYEDTLPLFFEAPFSSRLSELGDTARQRFARYLELKGWTDTEPGEALLALLREEYKIDAAYSDDEARLIAGIRYELALRTTGITTLSYTFAQDVDIDFISRVKEQGWAGVKIETTAVREYQTTYAAHILGRVGQMSPSEWETYSQLGYPMDALVGRDGVEKAFEAELRGTDGTRLIETDRSGRVVGETYLTAPQAGNNMALTLDIGLQQAVEDSLALRVPELDAARKKADKDAESVDIAAAVVVQVGTGDILASASYPTFDLSQFSQLYTELNEDPLTPMFNRALQGAYAPGSTFKIVTAVGGLEEGIITPTTLIEDTGVYRYYKDYQPMCWLYRQYHRTHGWLNVTRALEVSCNVFFYDVGRRLTIQKIDQYARAFGLGEATGVELPERTGVVAGPEYSASVGKTWTDGVTLSAAIGQSDNQFTPLQLANYLASVVDGGTRYSAHFLKSVWSYDYAQKLYEYQPQVLSTVSMQDSTLEAVKEGLLAVTQEGSAASYFRGMDYKVGAKTGSAQVSSQTSSNAVFVCFAPYDDPEIAIAIVVEKGGSGSELGRIARDILDAYFGSGRTEESPASAAAGTAQAQTQNDGAGVQEPVGADADAQADAQRQEPPGADTEAQADAQRQEPPDADAGAQADAQADIPDGTDARPPTGDGEDTDADG